MNFRDDPGMIRGRKAADAVRAAGGSAMDAALAWIATTFDETAAERSRARRAARAPAILKPDDGTPRTCAVIDSLPRRHP
jgi:hypothetical protein